MAIDRRTIWLGIGGAAVVAATIFWSMDEPESSTPARPTRAASRPQDRDAATAAQSPVDVNLEALRASRGQPAEQGRNPFRFVSKAPLPPPPSTFKPINQPPPGPVLPPAPVGPPPPPAIPLKFIGIVRKGGVPYAVLSDGQEPSFGKEGDSLLGKYRILKIGQESIEISYLDGRGRQTLRFTGQ